MCTRGSLVCLARLPETCKEKLHHASSNLLRNLRVSAADETLLSFRELTYSSIMFRHLTRSTVRIRGPRTLMQPRHCVLRPKHGVPSNAVGPQGDNTRGNHWSRLLANRSIGGTKCLGSARPGYQLRSFLCCGRHKLFLGEHPINEHPVVARVNAK